MKRMVVFLMLLFVPNLVLALSDSCVKPSEFTVDKRCYVTELQKLSKPYNAVVGLVDKDNEIYCTGTIVEQDGNLYVYTAKHCSVDDKNNAVYKQIKIKLQNGHEFYADFQSSGVSQYNNKTNRVDFVKDDWAIYLLKDKNLPYVNLSVFRQNTDALVVGYGSLKIMSDKDIKDFKQKYIDYLTNVKKVKMEEYTDYFEYGVYGLIGTDTADPSVKKYIYDVLSYSDFADIFMDEALKVSRCTYTKDGKMDLCQVWNGDSGGGIFDFTTGGLSGILVSGLDFIGGDSAEDHAKAVGSVNLQYGKPVTVPFKR